MIINSFNHLKKDRNFQNRYYIADQMELMMMVKVKAIIINLLKMNYFDYFRMFSRRQYFQKAMVKKKDSISFSFQYFLFKAINIEN